MQFQTISMFAVALLVGLPGLAIFPFVYMLYLRMRFFHAFLLATASIVAAVGMLAATRGSGLRPVMSASNDETGAIFAWVVMVMAGAGLLAKLYRAWILDLATGAEREPNGRGVRAWLGVGNLVMAVLFVGTGYVARGWDPVAIMAMVIGLLLAYPLTNCVLKGGEAGHDGEELAEERRRVLAMVEAGKISGEDGAELIGALGQSRVVARDTGVKLTGNRRVMMLGAALVVVGFCLPWFDIDLGLKSQEALNSIQQAIPLPPGYSVPVPVQTVLEVRGGDIQHGLGWIILAMAAGVAVLPLVWMTPGENREVQRSGTLLGMLVGSVLVMYLVANAYREMNVGMVLVMAGYVVMWVGVVREYFRSGAVGGVVGVVR